MPISKIEEFAKNGQKSTEGIILENGFPIEEKPARQWFNYLFNTSAKKTNEVIEALELQKFDTGISVVSKNLGQIKRTQSDKNNDYVDIRDFTRPTDADHTTGLIAAATVALAQKKKLQGAGTYYIKSGDVSFRFLELELGACTFIVDKPYKIILGGNGGSGLNPNQTIGNVRNPEYEYDTEVISNPTIQVMGAKNQYIKIGFVQYLQFYMTTDPSTYPRDASQAYNTFDIAYAIKISIDTDPTYADQPKVDGAGTANQWFNENMINLNRCYGFYMRGSYQHNHNIITGGSFENNSIIRCEVGNKNHFKRMRFEGLDITVYFGEETIGNTVEKSCFGSVGNFWIPPATTDLGQLNSVRTIYDSTAHKRSIMSISELDNIHDKQFYTAYLRGASNKYIKSKTAAFSVVGSSNMFELNMKDYLLAQITGEANAYYLFRVNVFGSDKQPLTNLSMLNVDTTLTPHATANRFEAGFSTTARFASHDARIRYVTVEVLTLNDFNRQKARNIEVFVNSLLPLTQLKLKDVGQSNKTKVVTTKPTQFVGQLGDTIQNFDGTQYTCRHMIYTSLTATSSSAAINVAEFYNVVSTTTLVNDLIGIELDNNSVHWTTVATISGGAITLTTALPSTASVNNNVYISRLI